MALRTILDLKDEDRLRKKSREVEKIDKKIITLLDDMIETMKAAQGVGLAAPQVGVLKRIAVVLTDDGLFELINPVIIEQKGEQTDVEGCLSVPGEQGYVTRPDEVTVEAFDREGNLMEYTVYDFTARAFCHEIDHLDGTLYIDKVIKGYVPPKEEK